MHASEIKMKITFYLKISEVEVSDLFFRVVAAMLINII